MAIASTSTFTAPTSLSYQSSQLDSYYYHQEKEIRHLNQLDLRNFLDLDQKRYYLGLLLLLLLLREAYNQLLRLLKVAQVNLTTHQHLILMVNCRLLLDLEGYIVDPYRSSPYRPFLAT